MFPKIDLNENGFIEKWNEVGQKNKDWFLNEKEKKINKYYYSGNDKQILQSF